MNTGFGSPFANAAPPPPVPPLPSQPAVNTNPANIFAQMKSGTFAQDDSAPQGADKYDALRPNRKFLAYFPRGELNPMSFSHATHCSADRLGRFWERERVPEWLRIPALVIYFRH